MRHVCISTLACCGLILASTPPAWADAAEPWTFVSTPDFLNVDVGDLTTYAGPTFNAPSGNSINPSWQNAMDTFLNQIDAENPDFVAVAGDLVMARWFQDATFDGVFEQRFASQADRDANTTLTIEQNRVINASNFYYDAWKQRFTSRGLPVYAAVGDHELGDDPSWNDSFGKQTTETYRDQFSTHFVDPFTSSPGTTLAAGSALYSQPLSGQHAGTAYAIKHKNALLVTVDVFKRNADNSITVTIADEQLAWLQDTLADANADATVDHIFVQGHTPVLTPVNERVSSGLTLQGGASSAFWQALREAGADLYLAGEVHDVTVSQDAANLDLLQIAHGGIFGFTQADDISYLKGTVDGDTINLEMKALGFSVSGNQFYQPGNPTTQLKDTINLGSFSSKGTLTIDKSSGSTRYVGGTGVFAGLLQPAAPLLGEFTFDTTGDQNSFTLDPSPQNVTAGVSVSDFEATGVGIYLDGDFNQNTFATGDADTGGKWPGANGSNGPSSYDDGKYVGFTVAAEDPGKLIDLDSIAFDWNRGGGRAPNDGILRVSIDGFATFIEFDIFTDATSINTDVPATFMLDAIDPAASVEFRFFFKDQDTDPAFNPSMRLDDVRVFGSVVPEPASFALFGLAAALAPLRRRPRRAGA